MACDGGAGVGASYASPNTLPVTRADVVNVVGGLERLNPVMVVAAAGLTPISPVMWVVPVVEIPLAARITNVLPSGPRPTGPGPCPPATPVPVPVPGVVGDTSMGAALSSPQPATKPTNSNAFNQIPRVERLSDLFIYASPSLLQKLRERTGSRTHPLSGVLP